MECVYYNATSGDDGNDDETSFYEKIYNDYHSIHGYVATILCSFGLLANWCNILVLTRPEMFSTINMLLTAIACCDSTLMLSYIVYLGHFQLTTYRCSASKYTWAWAVFTVVHADLSVALRACSLWLSVVMAALRSHILSRHQVLLLQSRYIANKRLGYKLITTTLVAVLLMTIPVFVNHTIEPMAIHKRLVNRTSQPQIKTAVQAEQTNQVESQTQTQQLQLQQESQMQIQKHQEPPCPKLAWIVVPPKITLEYDCLILKLGYWTNGLLLKLVPCLLLSYYLVKLIHFIRLHMQHSQAKFGERETVNSLKPTTFLLSAILLVTLLCELPNALASLFSGVRSFAYGVMIYKSLGDIFDLLALVNGITSFILYCSMSQMFRETFLNITCDIRDYFYSRSSDYYRRWSVNMFGQSQSTVEFLHHPSTQVNTGQERETNGAIDRLSIDRLSIFQHHSTNATPPGNRQLSFYEINDVSIDRSGDRSGDRSADRSIDRPTDRSTDRDHQFFERFDQRPHFGPSPSSSSEKLLNDHNWEIDNNDPNQKKKSKKKQKNSSLPMFDYANLNLMHTKTNQGLDLDLQDKKNELGDDDENKKMLGLGGSFPKYQKR